MTGFDERVSDPVGSGSALALALAFYLLGCVLLAFTGGTLGTLHAFGAFVVIAIVAALNQLLPVLTHAPVVSPQLAFGIAGMLAVGFALLIAGFYGAPTFSAAAVVLGSAGVGWASWNVVRLFSGRQEVQTRSLMLFAMLAFFVVAALGATMAGSVGAWWRAPVTTLVAVHAVAAILGFASVLIVAISYRFVPMFAVAHVTAYGRRGTQWVLLAGAAVAIAFANSSVGLRIGLAAVLLAAISIGISHAKTLRSRLRKRLDVGLRYGLVAWLFGIIALALAIAATWQSRFWPVALTLGLLGWIAITILGYAYKVAGFLAWQSAKNRHPLARLPALSTAVSLPLAYFALLLLSVGTAASAAFSAANPARLHIAYELYALGGFCAVAALSKLTALYTLRRPHRATSARALG